MGGSHHRFRIPREAGVESDRHPVAAGDHQAERCDCPQHSEADSLRAELTAAQEEVRRLRTAATAAGVRLARPARGWRGLLHLRRELWWALADSE
jgi:hypothetical protein